MCQYLCTLYSVHARRRKHTHTHTHTHAHTHMHIVLQCRLYNILVFTKHATACKNPFGHVHSTKRNETKRNRDENMRIYAGVAKPFQLNFKCNLPRPILTMLSMLHTEQFRFNFWTRRSTDAWGMTSLRFVLISFLTRYALQSEHKSTCYKSTRTIR